MAKRDNSEQNESAPLAEEGQANIVVGDVYKEKTGDAEVIPYFLDFSAAQVNYAGVGRSNEELMRTSDFLNRFEHVGPVSSMAEDQKSNDEALAEKERLRKEEADRAANNDSTRKTGV